MNTRKQRLIARNSRNKQVKKLRLVLGLTAVALFFLVLGWVGHYDHQTALWEQTVEACNHATRDCLPLIHEVQKDPHVEVIQNGLGQTWIEYK